MEYLPVTVDKSHLITIGERLYSESIELIRESVNNAYDADATLAEIKMTDEFIEVRDNGIGMKDTKNPRQAFSRQSKLLRDAFIETSHSLSVLECWKGGVMGRQMWREG
jgi:hypothetical protein